MDRDEAIKLIREHLKKRSGKSWTVKGGRGTAWGWIRIESPPRRHLDNGCMSIEDCKELATLMGLDYVDHRGIHVAAASDYRQEYVARAKGETPTVIGTPYWD